MGPGVLSMFVVNTMSVSITVTKKNNFVQTLYSLMFHSQRNAYIVISTMVDQRKESKCAYLEAV